MSLSIIIASRDEGNEIYETIKAIKESIDIEYEIIVVDDCSKEPVKNEDAKIYRNNIPIGFHKSIDQGVQFAQFSYIAIFNPRMRFFTKNWASKMIGYLDQYPKSLLCTTSAVLRFDDKEKPEGYRYGADIYLHGTWNDNYLGWCPRWRKAQKEKIYDIPCVQGANYFIKRKVWNKIRGFEGLSGYGGALVFLSLKVWLMGYSVKIAKDVKIGNIYYRENELKPWPLNVEDFYFNRIITGFLLLEDWDEAINLMYRYKNISHFDLIKSRMLKTMPDIIKLRNIIQKNKIRDINHLIIKNK